MDRPVVKMEIEGELPLEVAEGDPEATVQDLEASAKLEPLDITDQLDLDVGTVTSTVSDSCISSSTTAYETESQHKQLTSQSERTVVVTSRRQVLNVAGDTELSLPCLGFGETGETSSIEQTSKTETTQHVSRHKVVEVSGGGAGDIDLSQFGVGPDGTSQQSSTVTVIDEKHTVGVDSKFKTEEHREVLQVDEGTPIPGLDLKLPSFIDLPNKEVDVSADLPNAQIDLEGNLPSVQVGAPAEAASFEVSPPGADFSVEDPTISVDPTEVEAPSGAASAEVTPPALGASVEAAAISLRTQARSQSSSCSSGGSRNSSTERRSRSLTPGGKPSIVVTAPELQAGASGDLTAHGKSPKKRGVELVVGDTSYVQERTGTLSRSLDRRKKKKSESDTSFDTSGRLPSVRGVELDSSFELDTSIQSDITEEPSITKTYRKVISVVTEDTPEGELTVSYEKVVTIRGRSPSAHTDTSVELDNSFGPSHTGSLRANIKPPSGKFSLFGKKDKDKKKRRASGSTDASGEHEDSPDRTNEEVIVPTKVKRKKGEIKLEGDADLPEVELEGEIPDLSIKTKSASLKTGLSLDRQGEVVLGDTQVVEEGGGFFSRFPKRRKKKGSIQSEGTLEADAELHGDLPEVDLEGHGKGREWKLKGPSFSLPRITRHTHDTEVGVGAEKEIDRQDPKVAVEGKGPKWKLKGPSFSLPRITKGKQGEVSVGDIEVIQEPYGGKVHLETRELPHAEGDLSIEGEVPEGEADIKGPKWKFKGPNFKGPNLKGPNFSLPKWGKGGQGEVSVGDIDVVQEPVVRKVSLEGGDIDVALTRPDAETPDVTVEIPEGEIDVELPKGEFEGDLPEGGVDAKGRNWKIKGPNFKAPSFKGPHIKGPKFSLPKWGRGGQGEVSVGDVDIVQEPIGGKVNVEGGDLDIDIEAPEGETPDFTVELPQGEIDTELPDASFEGDLPEGEVDAKGRKWKIKGPKFKGPHFKGPSFSLPKWGKGGQGEVSVGDVDIVQEPIGGEVNVEGGDLDIDIKGPEIETPDISVELPQGKLDTDLPDASFEGDLPEGEVDAKGRKWKIKGPNFKGPHFKGPSFSLPKWGKGGQGEVSVGDIDIVEEPFRGKLKAEGDVDIDIEGPEAETPEISVELPQGEIETELPDGSFEGDLPEGEVDAKGRKWKIKGPNFKGPHFKGPSFSLPKWEKGGQGEVSVGDVDIVQEPIGGKVNVEGGDLDIDIEAPEVETPDITVELPQGEIDRELPDASFEGDLPEGEVDAKGRKWKIKGPKFKGPHFKGPSFSLPKWGKGGQGEVSVGDVDIVQEPIGGKVNVEGGDLDIDIKGPEIETPDISVELPQGKLDTDLPDASFEGDLPEGEVDAKGRKWKIKGPNFKGPHFKGPSFSLPKWGKGGQGEVSVGDIDIVEEPFRGKLKAEGDVDIDIEGPEAETSEISVELPQGEIETGLPDGSFEGDLPEGEVDAKGRKWKIKGPNFKGPHFKGPSFSLPKWGKGGQGEVSVGDVDIVQEPIGGKVNVEGGDLDIDIEAPEVETPDITVELPQGEIDTELPDASFEGDLPEGEVDAKGHKWKIKGPKFKGPHFKGPSFSLPKWGKSGQGEVSVGDVDIVQEPIGGKVNVEGGDLDIDIKGSEIETPDISIELPQGKLDTDLPDTSFEGDLPEGEVDAKGRKWKIKGPNFKGPHFKGPSFSLPKWGKGGQGEVSVGDIDIVEEPFGGKLKAEGDVDIDIKGPEVETPELSVELPQGELETELPDGSFEGDLPEGEVDAKGRKWKIKGPNFKGPHFKGPSFSLPKWGKGGQGEVSVGDIDIVEEPFGGKLKAEGDVDIDIKGPEVETPELSVELPQGELETELPDGSFEGDLPEGEVDAKGRKWKIKGPNFKGPHFKGPSFSLPKWGKGGQGEVSVGDVDIVQEPIGGKVNVEGGDLDIDIKGPEIETPDTSGELPQEQLETNLPDASFEGNLPEGEVDAKGRKWKIKGPNFKGPHFKGPSFSLPKWGRGGQGEVSVGDVDIVQEPIGGKVNVEGGDLDVDIKGPGVETPDISVELPQEEIDTELPDVSFEGDLPEGEIDAKGRSWKIKGPKFKSPNFKGPSISLPKWGKRGQGEVSVDDIDVVEETVGGKVSGEGGELDLDVKRPEVETPDVNVEFPEVEIDSEIPDSEVHIKGPKWQFKGPHYKGPSFSLPRFKGKRQEEVHVGDIDVVEEPYGRNVSIESPDLSAEFPEGQIEGEPPEGGVDGKSHKWKIKGPHFKGPKLKGKSFSLPRFKKKGQGEINVGDIDIVQEPFGEKVHISGDDINIDLKESEIESPDLSVELPKKDIEIEVPAGELKAELPEGELAANGHKWKIKGPNFKRPSFEGPSFSLPKWRKGGQGEVSVGDIDIVEEPFGGKVSVEGGDLDIDIKGPEVETPDVGVEHLEGEIDVELPDSSFEGELPEGGVNAKGRKWKIKGPSFKGPSFKGPSFSLPKWEKGGQGEVSVGDVDIIEEPTGGKVSIEGGDIDVDIKGPEVETPDVSAEIPEGEIDGELPEGEFNSEFPEGGANAKSGKWKFKGPSFKGPSFKGPSFSLPKWGKGGQGEVSVGDIDVVEETFRGKASVEGGEVDVDVKQPEVETSDLSLELPEGEIDAELPEGEVNIKGQKWKFKGPHLKGSSFSLPRFRGKGQGEVRIGDTDVVEEPYGTKGNVKSPDISIDVPEGKFEGELPEGEVDAKGRKWKIKGPHFIGPKLKGPSFSLPRFKKKGQGEVNVGEIDIVQEPIGGKLSVEGGDIDVDLKGPDVATPDVSVELPAGDLDLELPEGGFKGELPEGGVDAKGQKWNIKGPNFKGPNFKGPSFSLPKFGKSGQGEVSVGDVDIIEEPIGGKITIEGSDIDVDINAPGVETPDLSVEVPQGEINAELPDSSFDGELSEGGIEAKDQKWKIKGPNFSGPNFKGPNFSLPSWKKGGQGEVSVVDIDVVEEPFGGKVSIEGGEIALDAKQPEFEVPDLSVDLPKDKIDAELQERDIDIKGPKWKFKGPHFKGPSFSLPRLKGKGQGEVSLRDTDVVEEPYGKKGNVESPDISVDLTEGKLEAEIPEGEVDVKGRKWKIKGPHFKGPKLKGPSFSLPRFKKKGQGEISIGDVEVVQEPFNAKVGLEGDLDADLKGPDVKTTDISAELPQGQLDTDLPDSSFEGDLPEGEVDAKGRRWKIKGPNFKGPHFKGPSFSLPKWGKGGQGEVSVGDVDIVQEPIGGKVNVEGGDLDIDIKGPEIETPDISAEVPQGQFDTDLPDISFEGDLPEGEVDAKGHKWKIKGPNFKGPHFKGPSFSLPKWGKGGQGEVSVGDIDIAEEPFGGKLKAEGEVDIDIKGPEVETPEISVELPQGEIETELPDASFEGDLPEGEVDAKGRKWKIKGPKFKGPHFKGPSFSLPRWGKGGQGEVSVGDVDIVQEPIGGKVNVEGGDLDIDIEGPEIETPDISVELPQGPLDTDLPDISFDGDLPEGEVDVKGRKWKIKGPNFKGPHFKGPSFSLPKWGKGGQGEVSVGDVDIVQEPIGGNVNVGGDLDIDIEGPEIETPDISIELPPGQLDTDLPDASFEGDLPEGEVDAKGRKWKIKGPNFKGPHFKGPNFSLPKWGKGGQGEVSVGDIDIVEEPFGGKLKAGGDLDTDIKGPEVETLEARVELPQGEIETELPDGSFEGDLPEGEVDAKERQWKIKGPNFKGPHFKGPSFSLPKWGKGGQGEVSVGDVDIVQEAIGGKVNVEGGDIDIDIKGPEIETPDINSKLPQGEIDTETPDISFEGDLPEGEVDAKGRKWKIKGPKFKGPHFKGPSFSLPRWGKGGQGEVSVGDVDIVQQPIGGKVNVEGGDLDVDIKGPEIETPDISIELPQGQLDTDLPDTSFEGDLPEGEVDTKGRKWKIKGPNFKGPRFKGPSFSLPKRGKGGQGEVSVGDIDIVEEPFGGKLKAEGDVDIDIKGPEVETPEISVDLPQGEIETELPDGSFEGDLPEGEVDAKGRKWKIKGPNFKGPHFKGPSFSLPKWGKGGQGEVSVGDIDIVKEPFGGKLKTEGDVDIDIKGPEVETPEISVELPRGEIETELPDASFEGDLPEGEVDAKGRKWKIKGPNFKGPHFKGPSFSLPKWGKGGQGEVSVGDVDIVQEPSGGKVNVEGGDLDLDIEAPEVETPDITVELPQGEIDTELPDGSFEGDLPEGEVDAKGRKWKIKGPKFKGPHFKSPSFSLPKWGKGGQGEVSVGDVDIVQEPTGGKVNIEGGDLDIDIKGPEIETPDISGELLQGQLDTDLPDASFEGDLPEGEVDAKGRKWKIKGPNFKGPHFKGPSFSLPKWGKGGHGEVSVGDIDIVEEPFGGKLKAEEDVDIDIKGPEVETPEISVELPQGEIETELPDGSFEGDLPEGEVDAKGRKWKIKDPNFKGPHFKGPSFSLPKWGKGGQGEVSVGDVDIVQEPIGGKVNVEGGDLDIDIGAPEVETPDITVKLPQGEIDTELPDASFEGDLPEGEVDAKGRKWKIKGSKFKGPHFKGPSFSLPKWGKGGQGEVSVGDVDIVQEPIGGKVNVEGGDLDIDIRGPQFETPDITAELPQGEIDTELPDASFEGDLPEGEVDAKGRKWKIKGPNFKGPHFKGPSFSLPKWGKGGQGEVSVGDVDIVQEPIGGKVNVQEGDLDIDIKAPEVETPDITVELPQGEIDTELPDASFEGDLPEGEVDAKGRKWKIKGPNFKGPHFKGPSFSLPKWGKGGQGEVSVGDIDVVEEPLGGKFKTESDLGIDVTGPEVERPDVTVEIPQGEIDTNLPDSSFEGEFPEGEVNIDGHKWKIKGPNFKGPNIKGPSFSLPKWGKGGQGEVSVGDIDIVEEPFGGKASLEGDLDTNIQPPEFEKSDISVELPHGEVDVGLPEGKFEGDSPESGVDSKGRKWKIKGPNFKGPNFKGPSFSLPKWGKAGQGEISVGDIDVAEDPIGGKVNVEGGDFDADIHGPKVVTSDISLDLPEGEIDTELPEGEADIKGPKWKFKGPHFKGPSFSLPRFKTKGQGEVRVGDTDVVEEPHGRKENIESPDISTEIPEGQIEGKLPEGEVDSKGRKWKIKGPHFKGPKLKGPSFSLPRFKKKGQGEVSVGDIDIVQEPFGEKVSVEGGDIEVDIKVPEVERPDLSVELSGGERDIEGPESELEGELPEGGVDTKGRKWKLKGPNFKGPNIKGPTFSLPKWGKGGQGEVSIGDTDIVEEPFAGTVSVEGEDLGIGVKQPSVETSDVRAEIPQEGIDTEIPDGSFEGELPEGEVDAKGRKWKIKGPNFKGPKLKSPSFSLPKWGKGGQAEVSVGDVDIVEEHFGGKVSVEGPDLDFDIKGPEVEAPDISVELPQGKLNTESPDSSFEGELPEGEVDAKGRKWKIKGPNFKGPSFSLPKLGKGGQGEISVGDVDLVEEPFGGKVNVEGGDIDIDVKGPHIGTPGKSFTLPEGDIDSVPPEGEFEADLSESGIDAKGHPWQIKGPSFKGSNIKGPSFSLPKWGKSGQGEVSIGDIDVVEEPFRGKVIVEGDDHNVDLKGPEVETPDVSVEFPQGELDTDLPEGGFEGELPEGGVDAKGRKWKIKGPNFKGPHFKGPSFSLPKWGKGGQGEISVSDIDGVEQPLDIDVKGHDLETSDISLVVPSVDSEIDTSDPKEKGGRKWKIKGPSFSLPTFSRKKQGHIVIGDEEFVAEPYPEDLEVDTPTFGVQGDLPDIQAEAPSIDPNLEGLDSDHKWKLSRPQSNLPKYSLDKQGEISVGDIDVVTEPYAPGADKPDVNIPENSGDTSNIELRGAIPSLDISTDIPVPKSGDKSSRWKLKGPSFSLPKLKGRKKGSYNVTSDTKLPGLQADTDVPKVSAGVPVLEGTLEKQSPNLDLKSDRNESDGKSPQWRLKGPHISLPKFSKHKQGELRIGDTEVEEEQGSDDSVKLKGVKLKSSQEELCNLNIDEVEQQIGKRIHIKRRNIYIKGDGKRRLVFTEDTPLSDTDTDAQLEGKQIRWKIRRPKLSLPKFKVSSTEDKQVDTAQETDDTEFEIIEYEERILNERGEEFMDGSDLSTIEVIDGVVQPRLTMDGTTDQPEALNSQAIDALDEVTVMPATTLEASVAGDASLDASIPEITVTGGLGRDSEETSPEKKDAAGKPPKSPSKNKSKFFGLFSRDKKDKDSTLEKKKKKKGKKGKNDGKSDDSSSVCSKDSRQSLDKDMKDIDTQLGAVRIQADTTSIGSKSSREIRGSTDEFVPMEEDSPEKLALATSIPRTAGAPLAQDEVLVTSNGTASYVHKTEETIVESEKDNQDVRVVTSQSQSVSSHHQVIVTKTTRTATLQILGESDDRSAPVTTESQVTEAQLKSLTTQPSSFQVVGDQIVFTQSTSSSPQSPGASSAQNISITSTTTTTSTSPVDISFDSALARSHRSSVDSGTGSDPARPTTHFVVVAIDFGTTFSGYAFSFTRDPDSIHMMRKWEGGDPGVINQKTPTCLLLTPEGKFNSFGFAARDNYHDLDQNEASNWLYFDKFKMTLHYSQDLDKDTEIKAYNGVSMPALTVFAHSLRYFKDHALSELSDQSGTRILNEDLRWVISVPAIWKAPAKQFMRAAAYQAGIASPDYPDQLLIALEPEAASIFCRKLRMHQLVPEQPPQKHPLVPPTSPLHHTQTPEPQSSHTIAAEINADYSPTASPAPPTPPSPRTLHTPRSQTPDSLASSSLPTPPSCPSEPDTSAIFPIEPINTTVGMEVDHPGTRYIVVDCGGGTVDMTVHEMESKNGTLRELYKATGGPYGSIGVDLEFERLLEKIFSNDFMEAFKAKRPAGYVDLMIAFESRKRAASPFKENPLNVSLPFSLIDFYKKYKGNQVGTAIQRYMDKDIQWSSHNLGRSSLEGSQVETAIRKFGDSEIRWSSQGMLRISQAAMKRLFMPTMDKIKDAIGDVLNNPRAQDIKYMFLVGGFSESPMLQQHLRREFGDKFKIIIPQDVGLSIVKGAVMFGMDPTVVNVRRSRLTYGVGVLNRFNDEKHPHEKLVSKDGQDWCTDVFDRFVTVDQSVALGDSVLRSYTPAKPGQKSSVINIYCTESADVRFITDPGVKKIGTLCLDLSDMQYSATMTKRREIQTRMIFGDTEIKVSALDVSTGKCVKSAIDFLNK